MSRLDQIRDRLEKATPRPWTADVYYVVGQVPGGRPNGEVIVQCRPTVTGLKNVPMEANAEFISHAPSDIAYLLELVKERK